MSRKIIVLFLLAFLTAEMQAEYLVLEVVGKVIHQKDNKELKPRSTFESIVDIRFTQPSDVLFFKDENESTFKLAPLGSAAADPAGRSVTVIPGATVAFPKLVVTPLNVPGSVRKEIEEFLSGEQEFLPGDLFAESNKWITGQPSFQVEYIDLKQEKYSELNQLLGEEGVEELKPEKLSRLLRKELQNGQLILPEGGTNHLLLLEKQPEIKQKSNLENILMEKEIMQQFSRGN